MVDFLALPYVMLSCVFVTFPYGHTVPYGHVVLVCMMPDLCLVLYFKPVVHSQTVKTRSDDAQKVMSDQGHHC